VSYVVALPRHTTLPRRAWRTLLRIKLALVDRRKYESVVLEHVEGMPIVVLPDVFNPSLLRSGEFLIQQLQRQDLLPRGSRVLEMGSGAGAASVFAARRGCHVVAVDINPSAVRCTQINALLNNVQVDVRQGDLFGPLGSERFDVVLFNPPYYRGAPASPLDNAWRSPDVIERFSEQLDTHLTPGGHALLVLSSDGEQDSFITSLTVRGLACKVVAQRDLINETLSVYEVSPSC
jgi:release factor glutamine methyltransferase